MYVKKWEFLRSGLWPGWLSTDDANNNDATSDANDDGQFMITIYDYIGKRIPPNCSTPFNCSTPLFLGT